MVSFFELLKAVNLEFPKELTLRDGKKLIRSIIYIPPEDEEVEVEVEVETVGSAPDAINFDEDRGYGERILSEMLHLLDDNLGKKYRRVSYELYGNKRGWRRNKWDEMLTPGLCYVYYYYYYYRKCDCDCDCNCSDEGKLKRQKRTLVDPPIQVQLFLSFMLTELDQPQRLPVLYLYELQLCPTVRSQGLGTFLLDACLKRCCQHLSTLHERNENGLKESRRSNVPRGIALTVFGDNKPALRLYRDKLHMKIVDSRQTTAGSQRILRSFRNGDNVNVSTGNVNKGNTATKGKSSLQETTATVTNLPPSPSPSPPPLYFVLLMPISTEPSTSNFP